MSKRKGLRGQCLILFLLIKGMLPRVQGQGQQPRVPGCDSAGAAERSYPMHEARGSGWEEEPHVQGVVAAWAQEGLEELFHIQDQEGSPWGDTPWPT